MTERINQTTSEDEAELKRRLKKMTKFKNKKVRERSLNVAPIDNPMRRVVRKRRR